MIHVETFGPADGRPIVLLHGFPETGRAWRRVVPHLTGFRVHVPDQRGYGGSDKPRDVAAYDIDRLAEDALAVAPGRKIIVGHDWGGLVAWWAASRAPDQVERLVVLNAPHPSAVAAYARRHPRQALRSWYVLAFQVPLLPERLFAIFGTRLLRSTARPGTFSADDLAAYETAWSQSGALTAMIHWYRALLRRGTLPERRVRVPTLILWGDRDAFLEKGLAEASAALCDDARIVHVPEATHWIHHEEPLRVAAEIIRFADTARGP